MNGHRQHTLPVLWRRSPPTDAAAGAAPAPQASVATAHPRRIMSDERVVPDCLPIRGLALREEPLGDDARTRPGNPSKGARALSVPPLAPIAAASGHGLWLWRSLPRTCPACDSPCAFVENPHRQQGTHPTRRSSTAFYPSWGTTRDKTLFVRLPEAGSPRLQLTAEGVSQ